MTHSNHFLQFRSTVMGQFLMGGWKFRLIMNFTFPRVYTNGPDSFLSESQRRRSYLGFNLDEKSDEKLFGLLLQRNAHRIWAGALSRWISRGQRYCFANGQLDANGYTCRAAIELSNQFLIILQQSEQNKSHLIGTRDDVWFYYSYSPKMMSCFERDEIDDHNDPKVDLQKRWSLSSRGWWLSCHSVTIWCITS